MEARPHYVNSFRVELPYVNLRLAGEQRGRLRTSVATKERALSDGSVWLYRHSTGCWQ